MSTVAATPEISLPALLSRHHFLLRRLHSLTGIIFGGYIMVHLFVNATLAEGTNPDVYQAQVDKIHSLPFLWAIEWGAIYLPILYHTVYGLWITITGQPNVGNYPYGKNIFYVAQRVSAILLVALIGFHVLAMKGWFGAHLAFNDKEATLSTIQHINANFFIAFVVYPLLVLCGCYHLANGFWTAGITWGLTVSAAAQRRWGVVCAAVFAFTFTCGMTALIFALTHSAPM